MHTKPVILFDLDGTLTDPATGITNAYRHALARLGLPIPGQAELEAHIGPPLKDGFASYGLEGADNDRAIALYREYFSDRGLYENTVYPGIPALLEALARQGKTLAVATSKPWVYAEKILIHFGLAGYFAFVGGSELDNTRTKKAEVIAHTLDALGGPPTGGALMVGDRHHDVDGARALGLPCVGVLYGYGSRAELEAAGAAAIAETVAGLEAMLCGTIGA